MDAIKSYIKRMEAKTGTRLVELRKDFQRHGVDRRRRQKRKATEKTRVAAKELDIIRKLQALQSSSEEDEEDEEDDWQETLVVEESQDESQEVLSQDKSQEVLSQDKSQEVLSQDESQEVLSQDVFPGPKQTW